MGFRPYAPPFGNRVHHSPCSVVYGVNATVHISCVRFFEASPLRSPSFTSVKVPGAIVS